MPNKKLIINQELCVGCNTCAALSPDYFELDSTTFKAKVKQQPTDFNDAIIDTVASCPVQAIQIIEE